MKLKNYLLPLLTIFLSVVAFSSIEAQQTQIRYWQIQNGSSAGQILISNGAGNQYQETTLTGANIPIVDAGANFTTDDVESALAELAGSSHDAVTLNAGVSTALTLAGQELNLSDATLTTNLDIDHLVTLSGAATATDDYGAVFTGTTIPDNSNIQQALQALETAVEASGGTDDQTVDVFSFAGSTINLSLESDGVGDNTLDIGAVVPNQFAHEEFTPAAAATTVTIAGTFPTDQDGIIVSRNGLVQRPGAGNDYTIAGSIVTFTVAFGTGELVIVEYPEE